MDEKERYHALGRRLFRVRRTVVEMLTDRGYVCKREDKEMDLDRFAELFKEVCRGENRGRDQLQILATHRESEAQKVFVFFAAADDEDKKLGIKPFKDFTRRMDEGQVKHAILIVPLGLTSYAQKALRLANQKMYHIEVFEESKLLVNITKHVLVPTHELLSDAEKQQILERYKLNESQLPRIKVDDPVALYYGLKVGQVVRIVRPSETAGRYVTFRLVSA